MTCLLVPFVRLLMAAGRRPRGLLFLASLFLLPAIPALAARPLVAAEDPPPAEIVLTLRHRVPVAETSSQFHTLTQSERWPAAGTAVVVCDVWDSHHCLNAVRRVQEMAPRMNEFVREARRRGR